MFQAGASWHAPCLWKTDGCVPSVRGKRGVCELSHGKVPLVLVVDRDVTTEDLLGEELAEFEVEIRRTSTVRDTLVVVLERKVSLALVNMTMPECSADRLVPALRRVQSDLVVIITADRHAPEIERVARGLGIMLYLPKPISPGLLAEAICSAVGLERKKAPAAEASAGAAADRDRAFFTAGERRPGGAARTVN